MGQKNKSRPKGVFAVVALLVRDEPLTIRFAVRRVLRGGGADNERRPFLPRSLGNVERDRRLEPDRPVFVHPARRLVLELLLFCLGEEGLRDKNT